MTTLLSPDVMARLSGLVVDHYVFPDIAEKIAESIPTDPPTGSTEQVAEALTESLQAVNQDRHLKVRHRPAGAAMGAEDLEARYAVEAVRNAGGIRTIGRLDDVTGLLAIAPYTSPVHLAEPYVDAAFTLLRGVERLVVDLRAGLGGTPETVVLICGHLLGGEPVHLQDIVERDGTGRQFWTSPAAARLPDDVRICVLTSEATFSGCEELAYDLQALQRATIVGRRTRGGAHPVAIFALTDVLELSVPVARSVNAVTGANWEQIGVIPDVECAPAEALDRALALL